MTPEEYRAEADRCNEIAVIQAGKRCGVQHDPWMGEAAGLAPVARRRVPATPPAGTERAPEPPAGAPVAGPVSPVAGPATQTSTRLPVAARAAAGMPDPVPGSTTIASGQVAAGDRAGESQAPAAAFSAWAAAGQDPAGSARPSAAPPAGTSDPWGVLADPEGIAADGYGGEFWERFCGTQQPGRITPVPGGTRFVACRSREHAIALRGVMTDYGIKGHRTRVTTLQAAVDAAGTAVIRQAGLDAWKQAEAARKRNQRAARGRYTRVADKPLGSGYRPGGNSRRPR